MKTQVEAIKNIKIDKVTVWDSQGGNGNSTANFLSGIAKSIPPLEDLFNMAGMQLPEFLGKKKETGDKGDIASQITEAVKEKVEDVIVKKEEK